MKRLLNILPIILIALLTACSNEIDDVKVNAPTISMGNVTEITGTSAVINASVKLFGGEVAYYIIHYGTDESLLTETQKYFVTTENPSLTLTNLQTSTTYYYQLAVSSGYSEVTSEVHSFTTLNPTLSLSEASDITATSALFHATLNTKGSTVTSCELKYGTSRDAMVNAAKVTDIQDELQIPLSSLQINTTYYCELVMTMGSATVKSELRSFTTLDPIVTLSDAKDVTSSSALFQIDISTGFERAAKCALRYGTDASSMTEKLDIENNQEIKVTGLEPSSTYYIQLVVLYGEKERTSKVKTFSTSERNPEDHIVFADSQVGSICIKNWDTNGDGGLSYQEASLVTSLEDIFRENVDITTFDELKYFYGLEEVSGFGDCVNLEHITLPKGITSIAPNAFSGCKKLKDIQIPEGVTAIEWGVFENCSSLTSVTLPESLTYISEYAFSMCSMLTSINIPESVTDIGNYAFHNCTKLKGITIPKQLERIREAVFSYCSSLDHIDIPYGVKVIETDAFLHCSALTDLSIPETVKVIGAEAFAWSSLTSITIPEGVNTIDTYTFGRCIYLVSITIPESVTSIGSIAFESCPSLKSVILKPVVPPTLCNDSFIDTDDCIFYVPAESIQAYMSAWSTYASRIKAIP